MHREKIEQQARELQRKIWNNRHIYWPGGIPNLIDIWDPKIAAAVLDIQFENFEELGRFGSRGQRFDIAGMLDRRDRKIAVARKFGSHVARFTGAHEIGHWILHPDETHHRDRPMKDLAGSAQYRPLMEQEADYFAACFLMPRKLVKNRFEANFGFTSPLVFDDNAAFFLSPDDPDALLRAEPDSLDREAAVAGARHYGGRHFTSLAEQFQVSNKAMAIRLKELNLITS